MIIPRLGRGGKGGSARNRLGYGLYALPPCLTDRITIVRRSSSGPNVTRMSPIRSGYALTAPCSFLMSPTRGKTVNPSNDATARRRSSGDSRFKSRLAEAETS